MLQTDRCMQYACFSIRILINSRSLTEGEGEGGGDVRRRFVIFITSSGGFVERILMGWTVFIVTDVWMVWKIYIQTVSNIRRRYVWNRLNTRTVLVRYSLSYLSVFRYLMFICTFVALFGWLDEYLIAISRFLTKQILYPFVVSENRWLGH